MNRIHFWILTSLSILIVILLFAQILLVRSDNYWKIQLAGAQQAVSQGQTAKSMLKQLAIRIYQDSQKTDDQGLKDLMVRQQITFKPSTDAGSSSTDTSAAPASSPTPSNLATPEPTVR
jgi:uncharacterized protein YpmS